MVTWPKRWRHRPLSQPVLVLLLLAIVALPFVTADGVTTRVGPAPGHPYASAACEFPPPPGVTVECGYLTVPEDREDPSSRTIRLHTAIYRSFSTRPAPDPVVMLEGGPGGSSVLLGRLLYDRRVKPYLADRDVITFDQRGTGYSQPALTCPEMDMDWLQGARACRDRLRRDGVNLDAYTSAASAADLEELRLALGIRQWNLFGESYGSRLALTAMRDVP